MGTADLHIHSIYSFDATTTVRAILRQAKDAKLNVIAVTDHDEIRGSLEAHELAAEYGIESIPGAEITTKDGHLVALWIHELPPKGLSLLETLLLIGKQGGVAIAPHPFSNLPGSLTMEAVVSVLTNPRAKAVLKGMETHNMSTQAFNTIAQKLSIYLPLAKLASSDSHVYWSIGAGRTEFPGETAHDLRHALEYNTTVPIPYEGEFSSRAAFRWIRSMTLKKLGYASDNISATQPINTQKLSQSFIGRIKKKQSG
jgi:predicted metal-dependent phosphoesterase TrpH